MNQPAALLIRRATLFGATTRLGALLGFVLLASVGTAQNLAQNPGFETGNTSGWSPFGPTTLSAQTGQVHAGNYAARVDNRTASWNGIGQSLAGVIAPGSPCNLSIWVRMVTGGSQTAQLIVKKVDGAGTSYSAAGSTAVSSSSWGQISGQYTLTVSGTLTELTVYVELPNNTNTSFYVDDLVVEQPNSGPAGQDGETTLFWDDVHQRIDGFGASSAWRSSWSTALANMFFSTNSGTGTARNGSQYAYTGVGLSLLRSRIVPGGTTWEQSLMQLAQARGARVWSAPWSPDVQFKSNGNVNGGSFLGNPANYQAYANQLAGYVVNMKNQYGVNLYALSVQNEPDANVTTYESCNWTAQQIHDFIPYLSGALVASNVGATRIMLPESQNWTDPQGLHLTTMNDPATASLVGIIANHNYVPDNANGDQSTPAAINSYGKALWETEVAKLSGSDSSIGDGLYWARRVHLFLTAAQANAFHYWWLCAYGTSNEGLCDTNDVPAKRMYTLGNFSRFVRPGYHRIGASGTGTSLVSAYKDPTNGTFAVVAVNDATNALVQTVNLDGFNAASVTPWITSATLSLAGQPAVPVTNSSFVYSLPARSVVTFVGEAVVNTAPEFTPVSDQVINAGVVLTVTNNASDAEAPPQTLTFSLLNSTPTNATLNATNGILTWRPLVSQADTTNLVTVKVSDDGTPVLSATNKFSVIVNPLVEPTLSSIGVTGGEVILLVTGALGPDYTLLTSTNFVDWQPLVTTNPTAVPFDLKDPNVEEEARFYRIELGP